MKKKITDYDKENKPSDSFSYVPLRRPQALYTKLGIGLETPKAAMDFDSNSLSSQNDMPCKELPAHANYRQDTYMGNALQTKETGPSQNMMSLRGGDILESMAYVIAPQVSADSMFITKSNLDQPDGTFNYKKLEVFDLSDDDTDGLITPIEIRNDYEAL